jgi:hypothetical protein
MKDKPFGAIKEKVCNGEMKMSDDNQYVMERE